MPGLPTAVSVDDDVATFSWLLLLVVRFDDDDEGSCAVAICCDGLLRMMVVNAEHVW